MRKPLFQRKQWFMASWIPAFVGMTLLLSMPALAEPSEPARLATATLLLDVAMPGEALVAVGDRGHILKSTDHGTSWQQIIAPTRALLAAVFFADATHGWAVGQDATILATSDGGNSWTQQYQTNQLAEDDPARDAPLLSIHCTDSSTCTASGAYGLLLTTHDGGQSWQRLFVKEEDRNLYAVHMFDAQHLVVAGESGALLESHDGGNEWTALAPPYDGSFFGMLVLPDQSWLLYGLRGHVLRSSDGGANWQTIETGVDSGLMGGAALPDNQVIIVGAGGVVLASKDHGQSFTLTRQPDRVALAAVASTGQGLLLFGEKGIRPVKNSSGGDPDDH